MKLRAEVEAALARWCNDPTCGDALCADEQIALLDLVKLGVRLALAKAHDSVASWKNESYKNYSGLYMDGIDDATNEILALTPADILQAQPGAEGGE